VKKNIFVGFTTGTAFLAAEYHLAIDEGGSDLVVFA
jgi:hypothetical protein